MWKCKYCGSKNYDEINSCIECGKTRFRNKNMMYIYLAIIIAAAAFLSIFFIKQIAAMDEEAPALQPAAEYTSYAYQQNTTPEITAAPTPSPLPTPVPGPNEGDIQGCDERVVIPDSGSWLADYETKYVRSEHGNCIILRWEPSDYFEYTGYNMLGRVWEADSVTELARQNGYSLVICSNGQVGWVKSHLIVSSY